MGSQIATSGGVLRVECHQCDKRTALTKAERPQIRPGNGRYLLHAWSACSRCGADQPRLYRAPRDEATMFLAGDRLPAQQQIGS